MRERIFKRVTCFLDVRGPKRDYNDDNNNSDEDDTLSFIGCLLCANLD